MVRVAHRSYTRQSRTGWFLLLSLLLHLLVVVALNLPWRTWEELRPERKEPKQNPIRVSFVRPENTEKPEEPEVFAETSSRAQTPQGPPAEVAKATETALPEAPQAPAATAPPEAPQAPAEPPLPSKAQVPEEPQPQVEAQAREEPEPQVSPPPLPVIPKPVPEEPPAQVSPPPLPVIPKPVPEEPPAQVSPPPLPATPKPVPEVAAKRPASSPRRQETAKTTTQSPPKREPKPPGSPEPKRLAKLPEPAERTPPLPPQDPTPPARPAVESPAQPEQWALPRLGRIPLLSGEDLEKYAQVRSSDQHSASGGAVSLDSKELKYLSYFAHIKRRIERVWTYPSDAIAHGLQGQLHLKFVLRNDGHLKTVELLRSSGYKVLDKEAWDAVVNAGPFGAFPPTIPDDELHITARFTYVLDEDAQRIRMR